MIKSKQYNYGYLYNNYRKLSVSNPPLFCSDDDDDDDNGDDEE